MRLGAGTIAAVSGRGAASPGGGGAGAASGAVRRLYRTGGKPRGEAGPRRYKSSHGYRGPRGAGRACDGGRARASGAATAVGGALAKGMAPASRVGAGGGVPADGGVLRGKLECGTHSPGGRGDAVRARPRAARGCPPAFAHECLISRDPRRRLASARAGSAGSNAVSGR